MDTQRRQILRQAASGTGILPFQAGDHQAQTLLSVVQVDSLVEWRPVTAPNTLVEFGSLWQLRQDLAELPYHRCRVRLRGRAFDSRSTRPRASEMQGLTAQAQVELGRSTRHRPHGSRESRPGSGGAINSTTNSTG